MENEETASFGISVFSSVVFCLLVYSFAFVCLFVFFVAVYIHIISQF